MADGEKHPVVVVGAGAAGLTAAIFAAAGGRRVILLEGTDKPGQKILISGGGRCNVLPSQAAAADFHTDGSTNTVRKILAAWPLADVRRFFEEELDLPLRLEEETRKLFPVSNRARTVLDALLRAVRERGVELRLRARVQGLERDGGCWVVRLESGEALAASRVVLATGGLSVPSTGSDGAGLRIARDLGHSIIPTYPALTPLTTSSAAHKALAGVSLPQARLSAGEGKRRLSYQGGFLFTHRGYSGPAVLDISHVAVRSTFVGGPRPPVFVQWTPVDRAGWEGVLTPAGGRPLAATLREHLPERLALTLLDELGLSGAWLAQLRREDRERLLDALTHYPLPWSGHEGYRVAEVTGGGVPLGEVNAATMESRIAPGLYLCGELLDAFGPIGGYNFLWAWVTGKIAGVAAGG